MDKQTFRITQHNATGVWGHRFEQNGTILFSHLGPYAPSVPPWYSDEQLKKNYFLPSPFDWHNGPTVIPGLRINYEIHKGNEEYEGWDQHKGSSKTSLTLEQVYRDSLQYRVNGYIGEDLVFSYNPKEGKYHNPNDNIIAVVEEDPTFEYSSSSIDDRRWVMQVDDVNHDVLLLMFCCFTSHKGDSW
jgi:hypothetical protein